ncbi:replication protein [Ruminococcaceae bacterium YAD3003]|nr:replication protein [Ruminococcaceae bacterium YAD3003]
MDSQCNKYLLTINNPLEKGFTHEHISEIIRTHFKTAIYFCMSDEQGSCFHTHVFIVFSSRVRFSMVQRYFEGAHIDGARGSVSDCVNYVKKSGKWELDESKQEKKIEGTFEEVGNQPPDSKGSRGDMSDLYQMIVNDMSNAEILATNQDYILQIDKLDKVRTVILSERYKSTVRLDLEVTYISGSTGTGKTRGVLEENGYESVYRVTDYLHPFDGYACQPVICFDEFYSSLSLKQMLLYCDIYPIELPSRYTNKYACYSKVYIISNWELERQYEQQQIFDIETWKAFLRRIKRVVTYDKNGKRTEYASVDEYMNRNKGDGFYEV